MSPDSGAQAGTPPRPAESRLQDGGYTLIELLVVMIVIGILAAIAVPAFLNQRQKAHDSATEADVTDLGKEIATYFVDGTGTLTLDYTSSPGHVIISDGSYSATARLTQGTVPPPTNAAANLNSPMSWCVALTNPAGKQMDYHYSATGGLDTGTC